MDDIATGLRLLRNRPYLRDPCAAERLQAAISAIESSTQDQLGAVQLRQLAESTLELSDAERRLLSDAVERMISPTA